MKINDYIEITNENNLDLMKRYSDKYFDLAIVDPPYGIILICPRHKVFIYGIKSNRKIFL